MAYRPLDPVLNIEPAPLRRRFAAQILDAILFVFLGLIVAGILQEPFLDPDRSVLTIFLFLAISAIAEHVFLMRYSATPGKMLTGIYVGTETGARISHFQAIWRDLVFACFFVDYLLPSAGLFTGLLFLISVLMVFSDPQHRALHDRLAGTLVLVGPPPPARDPDTDFPRF